jgi:hypothetical protein
MVGRVFDVIHPFAIEKPVDQVGCDEGEVNHRRLIVSRPGRSALLGRQLESPFIGNF